MSRWALPALLAMLALAPELASAQEPAQQTREVFVRVECFFEPRQRTDSASRFIRNVRPGRPETHQFFFNPQCQFGRLGDVTLHDAATGEKLDESTPIFQPATFFAIGTAGCGDPSCPGSLRVDVTVRNDGTADLALAELYTTALRNYSVGLQRKVAYPQQDSHAVGSRVHLGATLANAGPLDGDEVSVRLVPPDELRLSDSADCLWVFVDDVFAATPAVGESGGTVVRCDVPAGALPAGRTVTRLFVPMTAREPGIGRRIVGQVNSLTTPDPQEDNNRGEAQVTITASPETTVQVRPNGAEGTASAFLDPPAEGEFTAEVFRPFAAQATPRVRRLSRIRRVEIAVLRRTGRPGRCLWLANRRGAFRTRPPLGDGQCDRGRWLRARGTRRWRFRLTRRWPPGRYTLYSRAVNRAGVRETGFSRREGNLVNFTIRRR